MAKKKEEEKSNEYRSMETPYHLYPGHRIVSNQLANHAVNTNRYHEPGGGDLSSCVTPGRERIRQGLVCNNVGTKSTSIKTLIPMVERLAAWPLRKAARSSTYWPACTYIRFVLDWNRRTVMRIHNAEFGLTLGPCFVYGTWEYSG